MAIVRGARVFISCGQSTSQERDVAAQLRAWLLSEGYTPYLAIEVQTIQDLNRCIIGELRCCDYFLFVNLKREEMVISGERQYRGSLFTNQELAVAYAMGFDNMILLSQQGVRREGVYGAMVSNLPELGGLDEVVPAVKQAVERAGWRPTYTRHLHPDSVRLGPRVLYRDQTGERTIRPLHVVIRNSREDLGAVGTVARLVTIRTPAGHELVSPDQTHLKVTGHLQAYEQTIWPTSNGTFDLLGFDVAKPPRVFLHSAADLVPRDPIIERAGEFVLTLQVFAQGFPIRPFSVRVSNTGVESTIGGELIEDQVHIGESV